MQAATFVHRSGTQISLMLQIVPVFPPALAPVVGRKNANICRYVISAIVTTTAVTAVVASVLSHHGSASLPLVLPLPPVASSASSRRPVISGTEKNSHRKKINVIIE